MSDLVDGFVDVVGGAVEDDDDVVVLVVTHTVERSIGILMGKLQCQGNAPVIRWQHLLKHLT